MYLPEFERLVNEALDALPPSIRAMLENVSVIVQRYPSREQMQANGISRRDGLLGLYEGVPLPQRTSSYSMVLPDKISIFLNPIEMVCENSADMVRQIQRTVKHELAHHFGITDERLEELGRY